MECGMERNTEHCRAMHEGIQKRGAPEGADGRQAVAGVGASGVRDG